jgi:hypothetical protein
MKKERDTKQERDTTPERRTKRERQAKQQRHTWTVDVIEENSAAVEVDGRQVTPLPRWLLPEDAREGDVLSVQHERTRERSKLTIEIDREATADALRRSGEQVRRDESGTDSNPGSPARDPGGDVAL